MNLTPEDKDYMHETFISRRECSECTAKIRNELAEGSTAFATIRQDLQYIKDRLDKKSRFNLNTVSIIIQSVCTLIMTILAAKLM
ncbi:MAG: hypothetical protein IJA39_03830 [Clostridia bacterium]|nr:hypothetical protein [Clostridia bacterium]